ncbi:hypothetical protein BDP27DRAFT_894169 [Rhodocollybia butyracea]|uniref:NUC153 domain-containing protein n=1 Tax=Rhodocollybia butyracea TaxID=206335 RepID=A0A9P5UEH8_9AGAR|nr:hypothetical protein BDP27DRAFT_894169 [Rhodocollybia butyracea]
MSDPRFARLKSDPRFRRPKKQQSKVVVDDRFKSVFAPAKSKKKGQSGRVDKYGRPVSDNQDHENLRRFYRLENEDQPVQGHSTALDYARGEVLLESSDEEEQEHGDDDSDKGDFVTVGRDASRPISITNDEAEIDLDENNFADLDAQAAAYNESNPEPAPAPETDRTNRLAIVNLDWDHVRAVDLYKICSSLVSPTAPAASSSSKVNSDKRRNVKGGASSVARGRVLSVKVYPSQFGKERLVREEKEGPPPEIFKRKQSEEDDDDDEVTAQNIIQVGDENEFDEDALRKYQLERLRYYYAILTCDTIEAASHIYDELEGTELERSANVFDLSFVPDEMTFEDEPREEATNDEGAAYKGVEFVTDALRHSKVKLTWDDDDPNRNQITRRKISRKEMEEADFKAYLASSSSESESDEKTERKSTSRDKLRSLLLGGGNDLPEGWNDGDDGEPDIDMEVTFAPGLSTSKEDKDETSLEKYQRKMKEKRNRKKQDGGKEKDAVEADDFFAAASDDADEGDKPALASKKTAKGSKSKESQKPKQVATEESLSLLIASSNAEPQHFNLKTVLKAEKLKGKKLRKGKKLDEAELQEDFQIDVDDDRFKAVHDDHDFAIDPSNPRFKKTKSMKTLLDARTKERATSSNAQPRNASDGQSLQSLAESIKRKSTTSVIPLPGKRRKLQ